MLSKLPVSYSVSVFGGTRAKKEEGGFRTSSPTNPAQPDVRIIIQVTELSTDVRITASRVATAGLSEHGLTAHTTQIVRQWCERVVHAVRDTFGRRAALAIEILMRLIDQFVIRPVTILDAGQSWGRIVLEAADCVVICAGKENHLGRSAIVTNGIDGLLDAGGPGRHVKVVRLVHQAENDVALRGVFLGELGPKIAELII